MISRRIFLLKSIGLLGTTVAAASFLSSCTQDKAEELPADACNDLTGLSSTDLSKRESMKYVGQSPVADKNCANCRFYNAPANPPACGGCQLFAGSVHPKGYCQSWFAKEA